MTNTEKFELIASTMADNEEIVEFCKAQIASIERAATKAKERAAAKKNETDDLYDAVVAALSDEPVTIADMTAKFDDEDVTRSKVQYRLVKAVKNGVATKVEVTVDGKKAAAYVVA